MERIWDDLGSILPVLITASSICVGYIPLLTLQAITVDGTLETLDHVNKVVCPSLLLHCELLLSSWRGLQIIFINFLTVFGSLSVGRG